MSVQIFASLEIEGKKFPLTTDRNYLLGRKLDGVHKLDIILESETVDAKHALIKTCGDELKILDLHSKSGTFINKQRLEDLKEMLLKDSDTLQIGNLIGSIRYNEIELENSSGFHEGPNNKSDVVCHSPNQIALRSSPSIKLQKAKLTSTPNCQNEQPSSTEPHSSVVTTVLIRKSYDFDQHNLNIAGTEAINDSFGNKTDSFNIPETQQCIERSSSSPLHVGETSMECNDTKVSNNECVTNIDHSRDNGEDDSYIPETQDIALEYINSQLRNHRHNEHVNMIVAPNIPIEENANGVDVVEGSQFRICTQEYNETNCLGDEDSNNSDLLATVPSSFIIPHIKHDPVILNGSGCPVSSITSNKECLSEENNPESANCNERKELECENDKELLAIQWEEKDLDCMELLERDDMCTPDLFFTPELGDPNSLQKKDNDKEASLETLSSFQMAKSDTEQHNNSMCEDSNDLMPTQVFTREEAENSKGGKINSGPEGEYLTLSDKENMTPAAVAALKIVDEFMDQTQKFPSENIKSTVSVKERNPIQDPTLIPPATTVEEDEDDLSPTQVFLCPPKAKDETVDNESLNTKCSHIPSESTLDALDKERQDNSTTNAKAVNDPQISEIPDHEFLKPNTNAFHSLKKASSTPLNATITESPDIDMLLCTPQLISDNFKQCETKVKENFLAKHKALFSDDSDDESDTSQMLTEAKPSRDFDKLLPHLNTNQISPKHNQAKGELRKFKHTFAETVTKKTRASKERGATQKVASRDERHETRDRKRDKKVEIVPKKDHKPESKTTKNEEQKNTKQNEIIITPRKVVVRLQRKRGTKDMETNANCDNKSRRSSLKSEKKSKIPKKEIETEEVKAEKIMKETGRDIFQSPGQQDDKNSVRKSERKQSKSTTIGVNKSSPKSSGSRRMTRLTTRLESETTQDSEGRSKDEKNEHVASSFKQKNKTTSKMSIRHDPKSKIPDNQIIKSSSQDKANKSNDLEERGTKNPVTTERKLLRSSGTFNNSETFEASSTRSSTSSTSVHSSDYTNKLKVSTTMVDSERFENLMKYSSGIWCITGDPTKCDILIMDKGNRTYKFLVALARGIPIVNSSWLENVNKKREIVNMSGHFYTDEAFEKRYKFSLLRSVDLARKRKLLAGYNFFMTSEIRPQPDEIKTIIECAGGKVLTDISSSSTNNQKLYLISTKNDQKLWHKYRRASGDIRIISTEGIMSAVMRQSLKPLDSNLLA